ncbi:MAG TPA: hypothetical protein VKB77_16040, partial [Terriglobales bacterium]|nr:hypothetical protein [Terriglobales bacterium]
LVKAQLAEEQKRLEMLAAQLSPGTSPYRVSTIEKDMAEIRDYAAKLEKVPLPYEAVPMAPKVGITLERPVTTHTGYMVGFIDVWVEVEYPVFAVEEFHVAPAEGYRPAGYGLGFPRVSRRRRMQYLAFEAKPTTPSLGELLRQIRTYQTYAPRVARHLAEEEDPVTKMVVVSPDVRFREVLERQGVAFWQCPPVGVFTELG